jgi:xylose isomerase
MSALTKIHPEDHQLAAQIAKATRFSACLHLGPGNRHTRYVEQGGREGYEAVLQVADELNALSKFGRRTVVYAINSLGSFPVDTKLARLAGLVDA